jgi:two-component sensor histidine kinase
MHRIQTLEAEVASRQLLLEEVIHRTKNMLQLAVATLDEYIDGTSDAWVRQDLRGVQRQLRALSRSHRQFYGPTNAESLDLRLSEVCSSIFASFGERRGRIALSIAVGDIHLERHQEISVSLMLQELLINALKHAFPHGRRGTIMVDLDADAEGTCHLVVKDDGVGSPLSNAVSTGLTHVKAFAAGLQGTLEVTSHCGTAARVSFPLAAH